MKNIFFKKIYYFVTAISCFLIVFLFTCNITQAGSGDNISGWAWNEQIGWVSFNSENCDVNNNGFMDVACGGVDDNTFPITNYGVDLDRSTGSTTGYAWSQVKGWIAFNPPNVESDAPGSGSAPGNQPQRGVMYDQKTGFFSGWARICSMAGNPDACDDVTGPITQPLGEGWISFTDTDGAGGGADTYQVSLGKDSMLKGYAYSEDIGWISFSSDNCDANRDGWGDGVPCPDATTAVPVYGVGLETNIEGYVWSSSYGWISLNCRNVGAGGCGHFYGVNIDPVTFNIGGNAWSSTFGWLSFEATSTPDNSSLGSCLNTCNDSANDFCTACFNYNDGRVYGWAKAISLGEEEAWLRLDDGGEAVAYGVTNLGAELEGFAWGGAGRCSEDNAVQCGSDSDCGGTCDGIAGLGWVSFNCTDSGTCQGGTNAGEVCTDVSDCPDVSGTCQNLCTTSSYGPVISVNTPPQVINMTSPNWGETNACNQSLFYPAGTGEALRANLRWRFSDINDAQTAYRIRVSGPGLSYDTGVCTAQGGNCKIDPACVNCEFPLTQADGLDYNRRYRWSVESWDTLNYTSGETDYATEPDTHNDDGNGPTFETYEHQFPEPSFDWFPHYPSAFEEVMFFATSSLCYQLGSPTTPVTCSGASWDWSYAGAGSAINPSTPPANIITYLEFTQAGQPIGLQLDLTDSSGYRCSTSTLSEDQVKQRLPNWIEGR